MTLQDLPYDVRRFFNRATGGFARAGRKLAKKIAWGDYQVGRPTVLCLQRALFVKDIAELKKRTNLNLPCLRVVAVKKPQTRWIAPRWRRQAHLWHDLNNDLVSARSDLEAFAVAFLEAARATHKIDAVAAANTDYWQDEALRFGCKKLGIPFLALSRESYGIGGGRDFVANNYKSGNFYFNGTAAAMASETCVNFMKAQPAMRDAVVQATGWPRYDAWRDYPLPPLADRKLVTVMAYGDPRQLLYSPENFRDVLLAIVKVATAQLALPPADRLRFVIKMKKNNEDGYIHAIEPNLAALGIEVVADTPIPELATQSRLIIGVNTLAVLEGLLADCAVAVPFWGDASRDIPASLLHPDKPEDAQVCFFPRSVEEFDALLADAVAGRLLPKGTQAQRLARFSRHSRVEVDLTASARFETFVRSLLQNNT